MKFEINRPHLASVLLVMILLKWYVKWNFTGKGIFHQAQSPIHDALSETRQGA